MRWLYSIAWWLALPLVLMRLWRRARQEPGYGRHVAERLGFYRTPFVVTGKPVIWIHAVSVGETRAAQPLIEALLAACPDDALLLTHMTPTGRATGEALFGHYGTRLTQCYLPYDTGWMMGRLLRHFSPRLCVLMETEVWPNLIAQCARHRVPAVLVNARLSERSLQKARRLSSLMIPAAQGLALIAAQTDADAVRLRQLGTCRVQVTGNLKFDVTPPLEALLAGARLRTQIGTRPVLLCASTREGEEALIFDALDPSGDDIVVVVPRHPQRFDEVARMVLDRGIVMARRSTLADSPLAPDVRVLLGDSMGEMFAYYAACDVAFIGGSLLPLGGQNLIEACMVGKPVLIGPHTFNFGAISDDAVAQGAALRIADAAAMLRAAQRLLHDDDARRALGIKAQLFAQQHRGATARTVELLLSLMRS